MYQRYVKRLLDIILSLAATILLAIPMGIIALWIKADSPGPVFFKQRRVGKGKTHFNILKFRTMRGDTPHDVPTHLLKNADSYITKSGAFLRRTSLDELPQFFNVLKGDMSLVGPRPEIPFHVEHFKEEIPRYLVRQQVRPGLTGWAQIHGRDELEIDEKAKLDGYYVEHLSFGMDVKCFFGTIVAVLDHDGVVEGGTGTLHEKKKG